MNETAPAKRPRPARKSAERAPGAPEKRLTLRQVKSGICAPKDQKATLKGLGFRRVGERIVRSDHPAIRGMVHKVRHLVEIEKD